MSFTHYSCPFLLSFQFLLGSAVFLLFSITLIVSLIRQENRRARWVSVSGPGGSVYQGQHMQMIDWRVSNHKNKVKPHFASKRTIMGLDFMIDHEIQFLKSPRVYIPSLQTYDILRFPLDLDVQDMRFQVFLRSD